MKQSALILSTIPPNPTRFGNHKRVFETYSFLKGLRFETSFLLFPFDSDWIHEIPPYYSDLQSMFDYFSVIPNSLDLHRRATGNHHLIDDWWDENIGTEITWLLNRKRFDVFLVNYTFLSKAFELVPSNTLKVLDTHDIFSGRRETLEKHKIEPEFFYTTEKQEKIAFDRADVVIGIKEREAKFIGELSRAKTVCIPYWDSTPPNSQLGSIEPLHFNHENPLRVGFIGAENSVNAVNIERFVERMHAFMMLYNAPLTLRIAGNVCNRLTFAPRWVEMVGYVPNIEDFYDKVDVIVAPLEFSTGIKIKVAEALAWQKPVVATQNGFDGFQYFHQTQSLESIDAVCDSLVGIAYGEIEFNTLKVATLQAAEAAIKSNREGFDQLSRIIISNVKRIVVCTDRALSSRDCFFDECLAQMIEYFNTICRVAIFYSGDERYAGAAIIRDAEFITLDKHASLGIKELFSQCTALGVVFASKGNSGNSDCINSCAIESGIPRWRFSLRQHTRHSAPQATFELLDDPASAPMYVTPLRYTPLIAHQMGKNVKRILVVKNPQLTDWDELALEYVRAVATDYGLEVVEVDDEPHGEFSASLFKQTMRNITYPTVFIGSLGAAWSFCRQPLKLANSPWLQLSEHQIVPLVMAKDGLPSLEQSIRVFVAPREPGCRDNPSSTSGWDLLRKSFASSAVHTRNTRN